MVDLVEKALEFANNAHYGQYRKYSGESYIVHPIEVMEIVKEYIDDPAVHAAALLHDVVEDCDVTMSEIGFHFGPRISSMVGDLTDVSKPINGNRAARKEIDRQHSAKASPDSHFAKVFMREKSLLLEVLTEGNIDLYNRAADMVASYYSNHP